MQDQEHGVTLGEATLRQQSLEILPLGQRPQILKRRRPAADDLAQPLSFQVAVERRRFDRVEHGDLVAPAAQGRGHLRGARQSDRPLGCRPAGEHCDTSHFSPPDRGS